MNRIEIAISKLKDYKVLDKEILNLLKDKMIEKAYEEKNYEDLINVVYFDFKWVNISDKTLGKDYKMKSYSKYSSLLEEDYRTEEEYEKGIEEFRKENPDEYIFETWDDLEKQYDKLYWNNIFKIQGFDINKESAELAGLSVVSLKEDDEEEEYLVISGCGNDMSYQVMRYICREFNGLTREFMTKISIMNLQNSTTKEEFIDLMVMAGLDRERLIKSLK